MTIEWKDVTSYQRNERGKVEPKAWEALFRAGIRVLVHRYVGYGEDVWLCTCSAVNIQVMQLDSTKIEEAKVEALVAVEKQAAGLRDMMAMLSDDITTALDEM
jgi:hypothetical protein